MLWIRGELGLCTPGERDAVDVELAGTLALGDERKSLPVRGPAVEVAGALKGHLANSGPICVSQVDL